MGTRLFGTAGLEGLLRQTKATTFSWALGNATLYSQRRDRTEFCTAVQDYSFAGGLPAGAPIVDVGANIGDTAIQLHQLNPKAFIVALEPVPSSYLFLRWNLLSNQVPRLRESDMFLRPGGVLCRFMLGIQNLRAGRL